MARQRWIPKEELETLADHLRCKAFPKRERFTPVDCERLLLRTFPCEKLKYEVAETEPDVLGFCYLNKDRLHITISDTHYQDKYRPKLNHTIGHEIGHAVKHTDLLSNGAICIEGVKNEEYMVVGQQRVSGGSAEWQADYISGALRIPQEEIWELHNNLFDSLGIDGMFRRPTEYYEYMGASQTYSQIQQWAEIFEASPMSMAFRLKELNILNVYERPFIYFSPGGQRKYGF